MRLGITAEGVMEEGETRLRQAYVAAKLDGFAETRNSGAPKLAKAADPPKAGSVSLE